MSLIEQGQPQFAVMMLDKLVTRPEARYARPGKPAFAAPGRANAELGVALRGIGYVDVEIGKLHDAAAAYRRCLQIDPNDQKARAELGYVASVRAKAAAAK